jgi:putative ABC transport system substrate-binding protein
MRRRDAIGLLGGVLLWPRTLLARQEAKIWRIGDVLSYGPPDIVSPLAKALERFLADLGYMQGRNLTYSHGITAPQVEKLEQTIRALVPNIDLLVVAGTIGGIAAKNVGIAIPTVFVNVGDPVRIGLVDSLAHPGGNMTGITFEAAIDTYGKRLQILKEIIPGLNRAAVLGAIDDLNVDLAIQSLERAALQLGVVLAPLRLHQPLELEGAFATMKQSGSQAVIVVAGAMTYTNSNRIADLALASGLPSMHGLRDTVIAGGLVGLGPDLIEIIHQAARQIDKIIRGTKPADIPVEQPTKYNIYVNLKTARALDLIIPQSILALADEVVE